MNDFAGSLARRARHTSGAPGSLQAARLGPTHGRPLTPQEIGFLSRVVPDDVPESVRERYEDQSLLIGTHDAPIESMLLSRMGERACGAW